MHTAYCQNLDLSSEVVVIDDKAEIHHIKNVLRYQIGDPLNIMNGRGEQASGVVESLNSRSICVKIHSREKESDLSPRIILACAIPKKSKFEMVIEKATELGADEIIPLVTQRTEIKFKGDKKEKKRERYTQVAINACKQCKRLTIPIIHDAQSLAEALQAVDGKGVLKIIPSLQEHRLPLLEAMKTSPQKEIVVFFIGPEGDFSDEEYSLASQHQCIPVSLGKTILKVETAAIGALACANILLRCS